MSTFRVVRRELDEPGRWRHGGAQLIQSCNRVRMRLAPLPLPPSPRSRTASLWQTTTLRRVVVTPSQPSFSSHALSPPRPRPPDNRGPARNVTLLCPSSFRTRATYICGRASHAPDVQCTRTHSGTRHDLNSLLRRRRRREN